MNYTLHQLNIFLCVVRHQSITKAAEELFLTQPAVSIQLKKLQDNFEIPLTEVVGRQLYVTDFGEQIAEVCQKILDAGEEINATVNQYKGLISGKISIAVVSTGKYVMPYFLAGFLRRHPQVRLQMDVTNKNKVVDTMLKNETDFALVSVLPEQPKVEIVALMKNHLYLVTNRERAEMLGNRPLEAADIAHLPFIFREKGSATRMAMERYINEHNIAVQQSMYLVSNEAVKQAVNAGLGISIMPLIGLKNELLNGDLQRISMPGLPITTTWMLVHNKGKALSPACLAFLEYLKAHKKELIDLHFSWTRKLLPED